MGINVGKLAKGVVRLATDHPKTAVAAGIVATGAALSDTSGATVTPVGGGKYRVTTTNNGIKAALKDFGGGEEDADGRATFTLSQGQYERVKPFLDKVQEKKADDSGTDGAPKAA